MFTTITILSWLIESSNVPSMKKNYFLFSVSFANITRPYHASYSVARALI
jgi:hypothetical protein